MTVSSSRPRRYVLDANALVGFFEDRPSAAVRVRRLIEEALREERALFMSAVNWGEVYYLSFRRHGEAKAREVETRLRQLPITVIAADSDRATRAGGLKTKYNLPYADAFAAELAIERKAWLVTADPEFSNLGKALSVYSLPRHEG
jgi:predicted nucleic acid-binding protein